MRSTRAATLSTAASAPQPSQGNSSSLSLVSANRHSRLMQPSQKTSTFSGAPVADSKIASPFQHSSSQPAHLNRPPIATATSSTPMMDTTNLSRSGLAQYVASPIQQLNSSGLPVPSANTSGLPAPTATGGKLAPPPSTISAALRGRQSSSAGQSSSSFYLRRSQSQRPPNSKTGHSHQANRDDGEFCADNDEDDEEDGESPTRSVEVLPPLKSASYISRLAVSSSTASATSPQQRQQEQSQRAPKPSQLVKPMVNDNKTGKQRSLSSSKLTLAKPVTFVASTPPTVGSTLRLNVVDGSPSSAAAAGRRSSSFVPTYGSRSHASQLTSCTVSKAPRFGLARSARSTNTVGVLRAPCTPNSTASRAPTTSSPADEDGRRRSLQQQQVCCNSFTFQLAAPTSHRTHEEESQANGADDDERRAEDDDEDALSDDDATTATTITQMSESNELADAKRELNNMIQMLTSREILRESERLGGARASPPPQPPPSVARSTRLQLSHLPKIKASAVAARGHISKSQSSSFSNQQQRRQSESVYGHSTATGAENSRGRALARTSRHQLSRPRSRIIFDPTSSQFHVSCAEDLASDNDDDESASSSSSYEELPGGAHLDEDESSQKLLSARREIKSLKSLTPQANGNCSTTRDLHDGDTIRRLKDCRGSLESLVTIGSGTSVEQAVDQVVVTPTPSSASARHRRSPVGQAIRSLLGIGGANSNTTASDLESAPADGTQHGSLEKPRRGGVSALRRHASLRADPRPVMGARAAASDRKSSVQASAEWKDPTSPLTTTAPATPNTTTTTPTTTSSSSTLGGDLLQRAGKRLSASSSSLTSKFKHMISSSSSTAPTLDSKNNPPESRTQQVSG